MAGYVRYIAGRCEQLHQEWPSILERLRQRVMLYRFAVETGLRQNELRSLTRASFDLEAGTVTIGATGEKRRKGTTSPLRAELVEMLRTYVAGKIPQAKALVVPQKENAIRMLRADLAAARQAWIDEAQMEQERKQREESSFLAYVDERSLYADFHALRHTRGVWLFEHNKATPREAQELMRVSSLSLVDRYTRSFKLADNAVAERGPELPGLTVQEAKATGTDSETAHDATAQPANSTASRLAHWVRKTVKNGYRIARKQGGYPGWKNAKPPVSPGVLPAERQGFEPW
ncbi:MAG: tyrosine-type recombinase/integrase [Bacillota bacterium]